jgi:ATP-binding cassette subfamily B multidrug efflux pump
VKTFVRQDREKAQFDKANEALRKAAIAPMSVTAFVVPSVFLILGLANAMAIWFGGADVVASTVNVAELVAFSRYLLIILGQKIAISMVLPQITAAEASASRLAHIIDIQPDVKDRPEVISIDVESTKGRVVFEKLSSATR